MLNGCKSVRNNWSTTDYGGSEFQYPRPHTSSRRSTAGKASRVASMLLKNCAEVRFCTFEIRSLSLKVPATSQKVLLIRFCLDSSTGYSLVFPRPLIPPFVHAGSHHSPLFRGPHLHIRQETLCSTSQGTSKFSLHLVRITEKIGPTVQPYHSFQVGSWVIAPVYDPRIRCVEPNSLCGKVSSRDWKYQQLWRQPQVAARHWETSSTVS